MVDVFANANHNTNNNINNMIDNDDKNCKSDNMQNNTYNANKKKEVQTLTLASCYFASHDNIDMINSSVKCT